MLQHMFTYSRRNFRLDRLASSSMVAHLQRGCRLVRLEGLRNWTAVVLSAFSWRSQLFGRT